MNAKLILKISHNLGANLSLILFSLTHGVQNMKDALRAERRVLVDRDDLDGHGFDFPTNGSGSPDSRASAETTVDLLQFMEQQKTFPTYFRSLPILGVDGSLAAVGVASFAQGKVFAKTETYLADGKLGAQVLAGIFMRAVAGGSLMRCTSTMVVRSRGLRTCSA